MKYQKEIIKVLTTHRELGMRDIRYKVCSMLGHDVKFNQIRDDIKEMESLGALSVKVMQYGYLVSIRGAE